MSEAKAQYEQETLPAIDPSKLKPGEHARLEWDKDKPVLKVETLPPPVRVAGFEFTARRVAEVRVSSQDQAEEQTKKVNFREFL